MNRETEIEVVLERSLRRQVTTRKLDADFNSAVWARVAAEERKARAAAAPPAPAASSRWLMASNAVGIAVTVLLVAVFGGRLLSGVDAGMDMPQIPVEYTTIFTQLGIWGSTIAALGFGLMYTPLGRRLRNALS